MDRWGAWFSHECGADCRNRFPEIPWLCQKDWEKNRIEKLTQSLGSLLLPILHMVSFTRFWAQSKEWISIIGGKAVIDEPDSVERHEMAMAKR